MVHYFSLNTQVFAMNRQQTNQCLIQYWEIDHCYLLLNYYTLNSFEVNFLSFSNQDTHIKENINTSEDYSDIYQWKQRVIIYTLSYLHYNKKKKDIFHTHEKKLVNFIKLNHL